MSKTTNALAKGLVHFFQLSEVRKGKSRTTSCNQFPKTHIHILYNYNGNFYRNGYSKTVTSAK